MPTTSSSPMAIVLAGGRGSRLHELTATTCKPALPFIGACRIVDWTMANLSRSHVGQVVVGLQYRPGVLAKHIHTRWNGTWQKAPILQVHGPGICGDSNGFRGTADALRRILSGVDTDAAEVLVLGADHIYDMDYDAMISAHRSSGAQATVGVVAVPRDTANAFGVVQADRSGCVDVFVEKPGEPPGMVDDPTRCLASIGIYVFDRGWLEATLARHPDLDDIGHDLLPLALSEGVLYAHTGRRADERPFYWRDVGTLDSYRETHCEFLRARPCSVPLGPQPALRSLASHEQGNVIMPGAWVDARARLRRTIVAPDTRIGPGLAIGLDAEEDARWFRVTPGGTRLVTPWMLARFCENRVRTYFAAGLKNGDRPPLKEYL